MKKKTTLITEIVELVASCLALSLNFIKIFHEVAVLPGFDANGEVSTTRHDLYYSIFDKLTRQGMGIEKYLFWISIVALCVSVLFCILNFVIKDNKKLQTASHVVFGVAMAFFLVVLFIACSIQYDY